MTDWIKNIPVYELRNAEVCAEDYNRVRVALRRLPKPIRFHLTGLRSLDMILEDKIWVVVDRTLNDIPVLCWSEFQSKDRAIHKPVVCEVRLYHTHGNVIYDRVLEITKDYLEPLLHPGS